MTLKNKSVHSVINTFLDDCKVLEVKGNCVLVQINKQSHVEYATFEINDCGVFNGKYFKQKNKANHNLNYRILASK